MKVTRVLHVSVNVEGALDETQAFYAQLFGLNTKTRPEIAGVAGHWFELGDTELHLVDADAGTKRTKSRGNHYCVGVDDIDAAIAELEAKGIEYKRGAQGDIVQIWVADPAGNTIELQQDRAGA